MSDGLSALLMSFAITYMFWQSFNAKVIVIFVCLLIVMEILILIRHRLSVVCQYCGFDPHVYLKKPEKAAELVKQHVEELRKSPEALLSQKSFAVLKKFQRSAPKNTELPPITPLPEKSKSRLQMKV